MTVRHEDFTETMVSKDGRKVHSVASDSDLLWWLMIFTYIQIYIVRNPYNIKGQKKPFHHHAYVL